ncbi:hypothetical protein TNCV_149241 [Trichonephila clavipes]|nr:hypothetical protein TNCV_149241 [Trichonephila clavipes]
MPELDIAAVKGSQYGGYDPRLVTEWVRIPSRAQSYASFLDREVCSNSGVPKAVLPDSPHEPKPLAVRYARGVATQDSRTGR